MYDDRLIKVIRFAADVCRFINGDPPRARTDASKPKEAHVPNDEVTYGPAIEVEYREADPSGGWAGATAAASKVPNDEVTYGPAIDVEFLDHSGGWASPLVTAVDAGTSHKRRQK